MAQPTVQQTFELALQHHQTGYLGEAEQIYRHILSQQPEHVGALHYLGVVAHQQGRNDIAVSLMRKAIGINPYLPEPHNNLGLALKETGQLDNAIASYRQAISLRPNYPSAFHNLGIALQVKGELDDAIFAFRNAIAFNPNLLGAYNSLGYVLNQKGRFDEAVAAFRAAIALNPTLPESHNNLANSLSDTGHLDEAISEYRQAIALRPNYVDAHANLGEALRKNARLDEAIVAFQKVIELRPDYAPVYCDLGNTLKDKGQLNDAIAAYERAASIDPSFVDAFINLGCALTISHKLAEALIVFRRAAELDPTSADTYCNLATVLKGLARIDDAIIAYRRAAELDPTNTKVEDDILYTIHFHPKYDAQAIAEEHRAWNQRRAVPLAKFVHPHVNVRSPDRRLRVGYVSPDFRDHCQSMFTIPLLSHHDHRAFEIYGYSSAHRPDEYTARIAACADVWRDAKSLDDCALCDFIRADRIDILVDLTMHMTGNRLMAFARKPAPVQVAWLAYPGTTGLTAIDYRLSDPYLDPPGIDEGVYSERTIRLPDCFWCYDPLEGSDIPVSPLPAANSDVVTFGCLNTFCKVNEDVLALWTRVLGTVKSSRLLLLAPLGNERFRLLKRFANGGIDEGRIEFVGMQSRRSYLTTYHRIDIALDTFPYNGHTTSLDSFWMGVPVVTLVGSTPVARAGWCQLSNLGLQELTAQTPERFAAIASDLADDLPRLAQIRSTLRKRMEQSPLMDASRFARSIEAAYRQMWLQYCTSNPLE